jgi:hypothetical protein
MEDHTWDGRFGRAPQIVLELDMADPVAQTQLDALQAIALQRQTESPPSLSEHFGGYSGGPLVVLAEDGSFLLGTIKEGGVVGDMKVVWATALDDVLASPDFPVRVDTSD